MKRRLFSYITLSLVGFLAACTTATYTGSHGNSDDGGDDNPEDTPIEVLPVAGISFNTNELNLKVDDSYALTISVYPEGATDKSYTIASNNSAIASVSDSGVVTAHWPGSAKITATTIDGGYSAVCNVTVKQKDINPDVEVVHVSSITLSSFNI